jgi:hypothetical protein
LRNELAFSLNTFAGYTHRHSWDGCEHSYCFASVSVRTVPFATSQDRTHELPPAVVAMDTITAMKGYRELATRPTFVNIVRNCLRHASPAWQTSEKHVERSIPIGCTQSNEVISDGIVMIRRQVEFSRTSCPGPDKRRGSAGHRNNRSRSTHYRKLPHHPLTGTPLSLATQDIPPPRGTNPAAA